MSLARWVPDRLLEKATHFDPEFGTNTYGDNCERSPRAFGLKEVRTGDLIFFLVRLARWSEGRFTGETGFFLIGFIEVESIFRAPAHPAGAASPARYAANAHVRRAMNDSQYWDGFWVFAGSDRSTRFPRTVPVDRAFADRVLRTAIGQPYAWSSNRSELQVTRFVHARVSVHHQSARPDLYCQNRRPTTGRATYKPGRPGQPVMSCQTR